METCEKQFLQILKEFHKDNFNLADFNITKNSQN